MEAQGLLKTTMGKVSLNVALSLVLGSKDRWRRGLSTAFYEVVEEGCQATQNAEERTSADK